ncbi:MAG: hypothetical protein P8Y07_04800 [Gemmatimonadales bacterium]
MDGRRVFVRLVTPTLALVAVCGCEESNTTGPVGDDEPLVGSLQVAAVTTGSSIDPDGYFVTVDGGTKQSIGVNETITFAEVEEGDHELELIGLTSNCGVASANPQTVAVSAGETASASFEVACEFVDLASIGHIAFVRSGALWAMEANGGNPVRLTSDDTFAFEPSWSPDGTKIVFIRDDWCWAFCTAISVMDVFSSNVRTLNVADADNPAWSPDGKRIAFGRGVGTSRDIWLMDADGSNPVNLTDHPASDTDPAWSPDGTRIAFTRQIDGNHEIYVIDADGSHPVNVTNDPAEDLQPAWSPDGTKIAFARGPDLDARDIYVMDPDGANPANLTNHPDDDEWPAWSPDGTRIAFSSDRDGNRDIYVMNADGSNAVNLTNHPADDAQPAWSHSH